MGKFSDVSESDALRDLISRLLEDQGETSIRDTAQIIRNLHVIDFRGRPAILMPITEELRQLARARGKRLPVLGWGMEDPEDPPLPADRITADVTRDPDWARAGMVMLAVIAWLMIFVIPVLIQNAGMSPATKITADTEIGLVAALAAPITIELLKDKRE
jgi:hypothetical protein